MADRFYIPPASWNPAALELAEYEARHCTQVMRHQVGDEIVVFNGAGGLAHARITTVQKHRVTLAALQVLSTPAPTCHITLAAALIKAERWEWLVEKATELGAAEIQPLVTERCVVRLSAEDAARKHEKWQRLMIETCKQCGQVWAPTLRAPRKLDALLADSPSYDLALIASLDPAARSIPQIIAAQASAPARVLVLIGPEGDFSPAEYALAAQSRLLPVTLGTRVLRAETAALSSLSILGQLLLDTAP